MSKTTTKDQVREQAMIVLADYATCKADGFHPDEGDGRREGEEIAKRIVDNYMILARPKKRPESREQEIADLLYSEAKAHRDQWGYCRKHAVRSEAADAIIGILYKREPKPGPLMTPAERSALRLVRKGADVYDYGTAMHLPPMVKIEGKAGVLDAEHCTKIPTAKEPGQRLMAALAALEDPEGRLQGIAEGPEATELQEAYNELREAEAKAP